MDAKERGYSRSLYPARKIVGQYPLKVSGYSWAALDPARAFRCIPAVMRDSYLSTRYSTFPVNSSPLLLLPAIIETEGWI